MNSQYIIIYISLIEPLSQLLSKTSFTSEFIPLLASTFKPNGSLSSTDEINKKKDYKGFKSESEFLEASSHPKDSSTRPK